MKIIQSSRRVSVGGARTRREDGMNTEASAREPAAEHDAAIETK